MKILIITRDYPPRVGGIGNVTINLEKKFKHFRNKVKLINFDGTSINIYKKLKLRDFIYTPATLNNYFSLFNILNPFKIFKPHGFRDFVYNNLIYRESKKEISKFNPDIIYLTKIELFTAIYQCKLPFVFTFHGEEEVNNFERDIDALIKSPKILTSVSYWQIKKLKYKLKNRIRVIPNGIDLNIFKPINKIKAKRDIILFAGRYVDWKGITELISVAKQLPQYEFWFAGKGALENKIKGENIINLGVKKEKDLAELYNKAKICVFPSWHEPFGLVGLEAMACGRAVIATPLGFSEYIENGKDGIIIPAKDEKALKNAIVDLMTNENKRKMLEENARKKAIKYSWDKIAKKYLSLFKEVINK